jgi:hypothetical protein
MWGTSAAWLKLLLLVQIYGLLFSRQSNKAYLKSKFGLQNDNSRKVKKNIKENVQKANC